MKKRRKSKRLKRICDGINQALAFVNGDEGVARVTSFVKRRDGGYMSVTVDDSNVVRIRKVKPTKG